MVYVITHLDLVNMYGGRGVELSDITFFSKGPRYIQHTLDTQDIISLFFFSHLFKTILTGIANETYILYQ